jgi:hypothetical protein
VLVTFGLDGVLAVFIHPCMHPFLQILSSMRNKEERDDNVLFADISMAVQNNEPIHIKCFALLDWRYVTVGDHDCG